MTTDKITDVEWNQIDRYRVAVLLSAMFQMAKLSSKDLTWEEAERQAEKRMKRLRPAALKKLEGLDEKIAALEAEIAELETREQTKRRAVTRRRHRR